MINGLAQLVDDQKENKWKEEWTGFYSNNKENYLLIKVTPIWMEISSISRNIVGDTITWQPPKVLFESKK